VTVPNQYRAGQRRGRGSPIGAAVRAVHSSIALDHEQDWSSCDARAGLEVSRQTVGFRGPDRTGGLARLPVHPLQFAGATYARQGAPLVPLPERGATFIRRCRLARGPQFRFSQHLVCQDTNAAEAHLERLSMRAGFYVQQHSERHIPHVRETVGEVRNAD
jgi:hypothetical protein